MELDVDPSLPLDNLDENIVCADALFTQWPESHAIVGNPPFLGGTKIRAELGDTYLKRLLVAFPDVPGRTDLCAYWFRLAHDRLPQGARAGLVGTSGVRVGKAREASLDYLVSSGGTIINAVSSRVWPGDAALNVSMVNWVKGTSDGPHSLFIADEVFLLDRIPTHLQLQTDLSGARPIEANAGGTAEGVSFGHAAFRSGGSEGFELQTVRMERFVRPVATGDDLLRGRLTVCPDYCIYLTDCETEESARRIGGPAFEHLKRHVYVSVKERADSEERTAHSRDCSLSGLAPLLVEAPLDA